MIDPLKSVLHGDFQLKSTMTCWMQRVKREREREGADDSRVTQHSNKECENKAEASVLAGCRLDLKSYCAEKKQRD